MTTGPHWGDCLRPQCWRVPRPVIQGLSGVPENEAVAGKPYLFYENVGSIVGDAKFLTPAHGE